MPLAARFDKWPMIVCWQRHIQSEVRRDLGVWAIEEGAPSAHRLREIHPRAILGDDLPTKVTGTRQAHSELDAIEICCELSPANQADKFHQVEFPPATRTQHRGHRQ